MTLPPSHATWNGLSFTVRCRDSIPRYELNSPPGRRGVALGGPGPLRDSRVIVSEASESTAAVTRLELSYAKATRKGMLYRRR
jgi:hypothetical protein